MQICRRKPPRTDPVTLSSEHDHGPLRQLHVVEGNRHIGPPEGVLINNAEAALRNNTGYRGRQGLFEIMAMNDELRDLVMNHASTSVLREAAKRNGMHTLRENGLASIFDGITTIEEVVRETLAAEE